MMRYASLSEAVTDLSTNPAESSGNIYHPIPFPEFAELKTSSNEQAVYKKWRWIRGALEEIFPAGLAGVNFLDVGANAGFYAFSLAKMGAKVTAFEPHQRYGPLGQIIIKEKQLDVDWRPVAYDEKLVQDQDFDVTLMLSVFQWMSEGDERLKEAKEQLLRIAEKSKYLIFELGFNSGKSCINTPKRNHYAYLIQLLTEATSYQHFLRLGITRLWGSNPRYLVVCSNDPQFEDPIFRRIQRAIKI